MPPGQRRYSVQVLTRSVRQYSVKRFTCEDECTRRGISVKPGATVGRSSYLPKLFCFLRLLPRLRYEDRYGCDQFRRDFEQFFAARYSTLLRDINRGGVSAASPYRRGRTDIGEMFLLATLIGYPAALIFSNDIRHRRKHPAQTGCRVLRVLQSVAFVSPAPTPPSTGRARGSVPHLIVTVEEVCITPAPRVDVKIGNGATKPAWERCIRRGLP